MAKQGKWQKSESGEKKGIPFKHRGGGSKSETKVNRAISPQNYKGVCCLFIFPGLDHFGLIK